MNPLDTLSVIVFGKIELTQAGALALPVPDRAMSGNQRIFFDS